MSRELIINMIVILVPIVEIVGILTAVRAIMHTRTSQGAIAWAVALISFPFVTLPLYWIFGRSNFNGYVKLRNSNDRQVQHLIEKLKRQADDRAMVSDQLSGDAQALVKLGQMPVTGFNTVRLLINGKETFSSIFREIQRAEKYVLMQFFIVRDDELGRQLNDLLVQKSNQGVRIYFLYDEIGCHKLPAGYIDKLRRAGIEAKPFHTTKGRANRFQLNFRNHRKIVVIDGKTAYVGGHNVGDEYMGKDSRFKNWRDTHLQAAGPMVQCVQFCFVEDWYWAAHAIPQLNWALLPAEGSDTLSLILPSGPADPLETCGLFFTHAIHAARKRIWIASPYFVPDDKVVSALQLAALRGVDVRILLPEKPDHLLVYWASFSFYREILTPGVKIYRYRQGFMHQKVMLVDDHISAVGTANLDNRSFRLNFEITVLLHDRDFAAGVERMLSDDFFLAADRNPWPILKNTVFFFSNWQHAFLDCYRRCYSWSRVQKRNRSEKAKLKSGGDMTEGHVFT